MSTTANQFLYCTSSHFIANALWMMLSLISDHMQAMCKRLFSASWIFKCFLTRSQYFCALFLSLFTIFFFFNVWLSFSQNFRWISLKISLTVCWSSAWSTQCVKDWSSDARPVMKFFWWCWEFNENWWSLIIIEHQ